LYKISFENRVPSVNEGDIVKDDLVYIKVHDFPKEGEFLNFHQRSLAKIEIDLSDCEFDGSVDIFEIGSGKYSFGTKDPRTLIKNKWKIIHQPSFSEDFSSLGANSFGRPIKFEINLIPSSKEQISSYTQTFENKYGISFEALTCSVSFSSFIDRLSGVYATIDIPLSAELFYRIKNSIIDNEPYLPSDILGREDENGEMFYYKNRFKLLKGSHLSFTIFTYSLLNGLYSGKDDNLFILLSSNDGIDVKHLIDNFSEFSALHGDMSKLITPTLEPIRLPFRLRYSLPDYKM